jgi:hypothetical protein
MKYNGLPSFRRKLQQLQIILRYQSLDRHNKEHRKESKDGSQQVQ